MTETLAVIAIGRNEGDRLQTCLRSVVGRAKIVIYVDSGSTDGSVEFAKSLDARPAGATSTIEVIALDLTTPFTAARARNEGFRRALQIDPQVEFLQFIDGDCEVQPGWLELATTKLRDDPKLAAVCGRRRERFPDATIYNKLCDIEWNTPIGPAKSCGGDAMIRAKALVQIDGYRADVIAGEEPEMCVRLRQAGWKIERLDVEMTLHDAAMTTWRQWWNRNVRSGHAYAEGVAIHGAPPERHWVKDVRRILFFTLIIPLLAALLAPFTFGISSILLLMYPFSAWRAYRYQLSRGQTARDARRYAIFVTLGKFPQSIGVGKYHWRRMTGARPRIIEYKSARLGVQ